MVIDNFDEIENYPRRAIEQFFTSLPLSDREQVLLRFVFHKNLSIRMHLIGVAISVGATNLLTLWNSLVDDPEWTVRASICEDAYLSSLEVSPERTLELVRADDNELVRAAAAFLLEKIARQSHCQMIFELADMVTGTDHEGTSVRELLLQAAHLAEQRPG